MPYRHCLVTECQKKQYSFPRNGRFVHSDDTEPICAEKRMTALPGKLEFPVTYDTWLWSRLRNIALENVSIYETSCSTMVNLNATLWWIFAVNQVIFRGRHFQENVPFLNHELHDLEDAIVIEIKRFNYLFLSKYQATNHTFRWNT